MGERIGTTSALHPGMRRSSLAPLFAQILASTAIAACGGRAFDIPDPDPDAATAKDTGTSTDAGTVRDSSAPVDANVVQDAGCNNTPKLIDGGPGCADLWYWPCGLPPGVTFDHSLTRDECKKACGNTPDQQKYWGCALYPSSGGGDDKGLAVECYTCVAGRRPEGYQDSIVLQTISGWLANAAHLERVSIDAFQILRRELEHHGAPIELIDGTRQAQADEIRHTSVMSTLAVREGATLRHATVDHGPIRELVDIAIENAVEGCIRETYGALLAGWQAKHAKRGEIRRTMKHIYRDETSHAELAWSIHAWIMMRLTVDERLLVEKAMCDTVKELAALAEFPVAIDLVNGLGLPSPAAARRLVAQLNTRLWSTALAA